MTRRIYIYGLIAGFTIFYLPILLATVASFGSLTDCLPLVVAPVAGLVDSVAKLRLTPSKGVVAVANYLVLVGLVCMPFAKPFARRKLITLSLLGWFAFIWLLLWNFVCVSGGA